MQAINDYSIQDLERGYFAHLSEFSYSKIRSRLDLLRQTLASASQPIFVSLGENCGPGTRMRESGINTLGSNFFDNLVIKAEDMPRLIRADFSDILSLVNLRIGTWEDHDSVFDEKYNIFFHHYFYLRGGLHKERPDGTGAVRRIIDEADIPLFLAPVRAQFEYLAIKFRMILRSDRLKVYVIRNVNGGGISQTALGNIGDALSAAGGRNFTLVQVVSDPNEQAGKNTFYIPERDARWGEAEAWRAMAEEFR